MDKKAINKEGKNTVVKIITTILVLFSFLCIFIIIKNKNYSLISSVIGLLLLIATMNIACRIRFSKEKVKLFSIISLVLSAISIPLVFKQVIFSYVLVVPAFIFSKNAIKKDSRPLLTKIAFGISTVALIAYIILSLIGGFTNV